MTKIEQDVKDIKTAISQLETKIDQINFFLVQLMSKVGEGIPVSEVKTPVPAPVSGSIAVDITPLEERLEQLTKTMISKADLEPIFEQLVKIRDERLKEAETSLDNVTVLLEKGLSLTELTASLKEIEAHLLELVTPLKK